MDLERRDAISLSANRKMGTRWVLIIATQGSAILLGLVSVRVISYLVPPDVYGDYRAFLTLIQLGILLTHPDLINHASRYWQREQGNSAYPDFLRKAFFVRSVPLAFLLAATGGGLYAVTKEKLWLTILPFLFVANLGLAWFTLCQIILNASERFWRIFAANIVGNIGRVLFPAMGVILLASPTALVLGASFSLQQIVSAFVIYGLAAKAFRTSTAATVDTAACNADWQAQLLKFGRPFIILGIGGWLLQYADQWIVLIMSNKVNAGEFGLAGTISSIIPNFASSAILQIVFPRFFREADQAREKADWLRLGKTADWNTVLLFAASAAGLVALVLAIPLLRIFILSPKYAISPLVFFGTGFGFLAGQANQLQYLLLQGKQDSPGMVKVMLVVAGIKTVVSLIAIRFSFESYLYWLVASPFIAVLVGRFLIRRIVFRH